MNILKNLIDKNLDKKEVKGYIDELAEFWNKETKIVMEDIKEFNQRRNKPRKEVIEKAKQFIQIDQYRDNRGYFNVIDPRSADMSRYYVKNIDFRFNAKRRWVALRILTVDGHVIGRHKVKCLPGDVFNLDIGKAIVLGRALGLDVKEFTHAPNPVHYAEGQIYKYGELYSDSHAKY